ncbi:transcription factor SPEECHLESS-like [Bidens hawaiensis]|uniref:transcription factor SPEECHLESS-like n=1 Tax=Bidens hawaiensis TaxID=980011 RepID=UPI004049391F
MNCESFSLPDFVGPSAGVTSPDDIFGILEALEGVSDEYMTLNTLDETSCDITDSGLDQLVSPKSAVEAFSPRTKRQKVSLPLEEGNENSDGPLKTNHVTVEKNRRKQMNENLAVLRSLMPCFYVKRGDQASIIGGVINFITELQQVLQSLEAKKQRKVYSDVLSPRLLSSPRTIPPSPRKSPLSPRPSLPISPRTQQSASPYRHRLSSSMANTTPASPSYSSNSDTINELVANSRSSIADVEVKFSGANLLLKTVSPRLPGQVTKIISALEDLSLEILEATINTVDERLVNSFTIKIGIECKLSAEDLAQHIQLIFS